MWHLLTVCVCLFVSGVGRKAVGIQTGESGSGREEVCAACVAVRTWDMSQVIPDNFLEDVWKF